MINLKSSRQETSRKSGTLWKKTNLWIIDLEEGDETNVNRTENIFNKIIGDNFSNLKIDIPIKVWGTYRTPDRQDQTHKNQTLKVQRNAIESCWNVIQHNSNTHIWFEKHHHRAHDLEPH